MELQYVVMVDQMEGGRMWMRYRLWTEDQIAVALTRENVWVFGRVHDEDVPTDLLESKWRDKVRKGIGGVPYVRIGKNGLISLDAFIERVPANGVYPNGIW